MEREIINKNRKESNTLVSIKELKEDLPKVIGRIDYNKELILEKIFNNIKNSKKSDMIISYGNNNYVLKILLTKIAKQNARDSRKLKIINFNSFIHSSEEIVLKKIISELGIDDLSAGYDNAQRAIEYYYNNYPQDEETIFIIFFENIEHLFVKKKQVLFYTILEMVNYSKNLLFCGLTANYNLMDMMEKRNRSRFSQKTISINIEDSIGTIRGMIKLFKDVADDLSYDSKHPINLVLSCMNEENFPSFFSIFTKYIDIGLGIKEIITKIKLIFTLISIEMNKLEDDNIIPLNYVIIIIQEVINKFEEEEKMGSYINLLKNFPKLHIILIICLLRRVARDKDRITIGMIYQEYSEYVSPKFHSGLSKIKLDMILVKKALEELANSNLIHIKNDEKYVNLYELKLPVGITKNVIEKLAEMPGMSFDREMVSMLHSISY